MYLAGSRGLLALTLWWLGPLVAQDLFFNLLLLLHQSSSETKTATSANSLSISASYNSPQYLLLNSAILYAKAAEYASSAASSDEAEEQAASAGGPPPPPPELNQAPLTPGHEIKLTCHIPKEPDIEFLWSRIRLQPLHYNMGQTSPAPPPSLNSNEEQLLAGDPRFIINKQELIIKSPNYDDVGDYFCKVKDPHDDVDGKKMIAVRLRPYIHDFALTDSTLKSAVVPEGARLVIPCNVTDDYYPNITITWHMSKFNDENEMIQLNQDDQDDGIMILAHNATSKALVFKRVNQQHRRFYKCLVSNGIVDNSRVILIRVKNQFTFFWPLVGIIIEIVILFGVICVVQKKRVEPDADTRDRKAIQM